jgi:ribosome biogenesis SPOUT family RNA methylase Rps3
MTRQEVRNKDHGTRFFRLMCLDRTSELRQKGYAGRCLGPKQMTTDTAVRVTRMVIQDQSQS